MTDREMLRLKLEGNEMTLRDYFAAKAMQGMLAAGEYCPTPDLARYAYQVADAMLQAREANE